MNVGAFPGVVILQEMPSGYRNKIIITTLLFSNTNSSLVMQRLKRIQHWIPELYLVASTLFYWVSTAHLLNPFAIFLLAILCSLFIWKSKILGLVISFVMLTLSIFMVFALISELKEFRSFNGEAKIMLIVGTLWLGLNMVSGIFMLVKWHRYEPISRGNPDLQRA